MKLNSNCHKNYRVKKRRLKVQVLNKFRGKIDVYQENTKEAKLRERVPIEF